jgi:hypothetical protein
MMASWVKWLAVRSALCDAFKPLQCTCKSQQGVRIFNLNFLVVHVVGVANYAPKALAAAVATRLHSWMGLLLPSCIHSHYCCHCLPVRLNPYKRAAAAAAAGTVCLGCFRLAALTGWPAPHQSQQQSFWRAGRQQARQR